MKYLLPFGTYGIRGNAQTHPFTPKHLKTLGQAIELWLCHKGWSKTILIGSDTRASSPRIKHELSAGFSQDAHIYDAQVIPTPGVIALLKKHPEFSCGIIITASHNPAHDNGIKIILRHGAEFTINDQQQIQGFFNACFLPQAYMPTREAQYTIYTTAFSEYITKLRKNFAPRFLSGISIGLDCANGATSNYAPELFESFGARVITINASPNGQNINKHCGSNDPSALRSLVIEKKLSCGFAFDGDGDRVVAIDHQGVIKDGDDLLAILTSNPTRKQRGPIIGTIMSNSNLENALAQHNQTFIAANVGELEVIKAMETHQSNLGGEPSGHIIMREYLMCSDGIFAALATLDAALMTNNMKLTSFKHQPHALKNVSVSQKISLETPQLQSILTKYKELATKNTLLVRYSGTEPLLRILLEANSYELANTLVNNLAQELISTINLLAKSPTSPPIPEQTGKVATNITYLDRTQ